VQNLLPRLRGKAEKFATERRARVNVDPHISGRALFVVHSCRHETFFPGKSLAGLVFSYRASCRSGGGPDVSVQRSDVPLGTRSRVTKP
jgi:hypothetical protein